MIRWALRAMQLASLPNEKSTVFMSMETLKRLNLTLYIRLRMDLFRDRGGMGT